MRKVKTYFEQVSVEAVKKLTAAPGELSRIAVCCLCDRSVPIEHSKTDEYGRAVHEECYIARLELETATTFAGAHPSERKL